MIVFENPILAGVTLIREAIQSQNFQSGVSGWQIKADGKAELTDLTIRSSDGSSTTIDLANGVITIRRADGDVVARISATGIDFYDSAGEVAMRVIHPEEDFEGGFWTRSFEDPPVTSQLSGGKVEFLPISFEGLEEGRIGYYYDPDPEFLDSYLYMLAHPRDLGSQDMAEILISAESASDSAYVSMYPELRVFGPVTAENIQAGTFQITPTVADQWTSNTFVEFDEPFQKVPVVMVTPSAGGPGTGGSVTCEWQTTGVTTTGFNCRIRRGNTGTLTLSYLAVSTGNYP